MTSNAVTAVAFLYTYVMHNLPHCVSIGVRLVLIIAPSSCSDMVAEGAGDTVYESEKLRLCELEFAILKSRYAGKVRTRQYNERSRITVRLYTTGRSNT